MTDNGVNKVYYSEQPESEPTDVPQGTILFNPQRYIYEGEYTKQEGDYYFVADNTLATYKMIHGTDRTLWNQLERFLNTIPNGPYMMDSRDDGITIHNLNMNQAASYTYRYAGGNGELLSFSIKTSKKKKNVQATQSSTIDPKTKSVTTTVSQSLTDEATIPTPIFKALVDVPDRDTWNLQNVLKGNKSGLTYEQYVEKERQTKISAVKDVESTKEALKADYQVTPDDVREYLAQIKSTFDEKISNAENNGDIAPLLGINSMGNFVVKKKVPVRTILRPEDYGDDTQISAFSTAGGYGGGNHGHNTASLASKYKTGLKNLQNNPNIVYIGTTKEWPEGMTPYHSGFYPSAEVIINQEVEFELDGARIFSDVSAQGLQDAWASNSLGDAITKQLDGSLKVIGNPSLVSSRVIKLLNLSERFSGDWYIKEVKHVINAGTGYTCEASVIRKGLPISVASTKLSVDMNKIYSEFHKVAKETVDSKYANRKLNNSLKQEFRKTYTNDKGDIIKKNSEVVSVDQYNPSDSTIPIRPASQDMVNIFEEREKARDKQGR